MAVRRSVLRAGDRVLFVDEWASTGGQALACQHLVDDAEARWLGAAVVVDALASSADRRR
jgi:adenine phosphoribosyltransferase